LRRTVTFKLARDNFAAVKKRNGTFRAGYITMNVKTFIALREHFEYPLKKASKNNGCAEKNNT
jgi:hypothetical protein